jgi:glycosyltransferase involved in cell wall biosynthesis
MSTRTVCLIGPGHVASNPRLVKEADALHAAGFRVRVVSGTSHPLVEPLDRALLASRPWSAVRIPLGTKWGRAPRALRTRLSAWAAWGGWLRTPTAVVWAESELAGRLARAAATEPADLYLGHYPAGLYAAWQAARRHGTAYGFDAEDSHVDELPDTPEHCGRRAAREWLERRLLAGCAHLTAASPLIADAYERRYGMKPFPVLNVFPLSEAPTSQGTTPYLRGEGPPTLYWFSQTIGAGRGLEEVVAALGHMTIPAVLHLRGIPAAGYRERLEQYAAVCGAADRIVWHPPAEPDEMVRLAAGYDLGLSLELTEPPNRAICLTNKAFTYLLAGVPVALSRTPAQEWLAGELGDAALVLELPTPTSVAARLDEVLADRGSLARRRSEAWRAARSRFNWDTEQIPWLESIRAAVLSSSPRAVSPGRARITQPRAARS